MASERDALLPRNRSTSYPPPRSSSSSAGQPATGTTTTTTYSEDTGIRRPPPAPLDYSSSDSDDDEEGDVSSVAAVLRGRPAIYENASGPAALPVGDSEEDHVVMEDEHDDGNEADESGVEGDDDDDDTAENAIIRLARRLRCLFAAITWPIVPLGTVVALALFYMLYAAFVLRNDGTVWTPAQAQNSEQDDGGGTQEQEPCAHPLHAYAWASLLLALYTPNHKRIRTRLFAAQHAAHTGDGRPPAVRRYDQIFHTLALLYVYAGITLVQTCNEDVLMDGSGGGGGDNAVVVAKAGATSDGGGDDDPNADGSTALLNDLHNYNNACQATCPALTEAVTLYVATLELFTLSLILPLLFLPCIYLWFLRQATTNQEALADLQQRLREDDEDDDFVFNSLTGNSRRGGAATVTAEEILRRLQTIRLVRRQQDDDDDDDKVRIVSTDPAVRETWEAKEGARECCICMSDFYIHDEDDDETNINNNDIETANANNNSTADQEEVIVRTAGCGHLFHEHCIANWIGGRWEQQPQSPRSSSSNRLSRAASSPSHRGDAAAAADNGVAGGDTASADNGDAGGDAANTADGNSRSRNTAATAERQRHRQRRARRTTCPLCRADLRHEGSGGRTQYSTF